MNLKNKLRVPKSLVTLCLTGIVLILLTQGCNKEDYNSPDRDQIINSIEFEDYIKANIKLVSLYQKAFSMSKNTKISDNMKTGISPEGATYRTYPFKIDQNLLKDASEKREIFISKYPSFKNYNYERKKEFIEQAMFVSKSINELLLKNGLNTNEKQLLRLKSEPVEDYGVYSYDDYMDALMDAMDYSCNSDNECSGYVFADGTAVLYINPKATHAKTNYPGPVVNYCIDDADVTIYDGNIVESTYHTHFNSKEFSDKDHNTQSNNYPNSTLIILYDDNIYEYTYEYGYFLP